MSTFTTRPVIMGTRGVVTSGHYLASAAGFRIMEQGGNAVDAAAAMCFCLNLLEPHANGLGGEAPTLIYSAQERKAFAVCGLGWSPQALTIEWCREHKIDPIPGDGYLPACVPAVVDTWALAVARFGTLSFSQILQPAIELAENGFPVYERLRDGIAENATRFAEQYPTTGAIYCPGGRVLRIGDVLRNSDWANALRLMCRAEETAKHKGRVAGIEAARDVFYKGQIAERIIEFITDNPVEDASGAAHTGLLSYADLAEWHATLEEPVSLNYRGLDVHKCPAWTQGPVFLQQLAILEGFDLRAMGHNSADYLHTWIECAKLAFADREAYYGARLSARRLRTSCGPATWDAARRTMQRSTCGRTTARRWELTSATPPTWMRLTARATWSPPRPAAAGSPRRPSSRAWAFRWAHAGRCST
jgi:gamma-glutamyltranspeptidase/glutathione hydrolase